MRPYWKGYLKLALVSCPIALHAACSTAERIALRQINKATGNRLRQQLIDEETREPVAPEHKGRGYEVAKGQYLIVEDAELDAIEIESTHPRSHARQGHGGARAAGAVEARAGDRAGGL
jgi:DNA end-binding protein Ku